MGLQLHQVEGGFSDGRVNYLSGTGAPGGDAGFQDAAPVGSYYSNDANGDSWKKILGGSGADRWSNVSVSVNGISWREPVEVRDGVTTVIPTGTPGSPITIDGESITDGQRVLFDVMTTPTEQNVWIYDQASGAFTEDTNAESLGDTLYVIRGTSAGFTYSYSNADTWVRTNSATLDEIGYLRAFVGKAAGANGVDDPNYGATPDYVTNGDSLLLAITKITAALKSVDDVQSASLTSLGLEADGTIGATAFDTSNYLSGQTSYLNALLALDSVLAANEGDVVGTSADGVTTLTVVDSVPQVEGVAAEWILYVEEAATPANRRVVKIIAIHDDGTEVDTSRFAIVKRGSAISGLSYDVVADGIDMKLQVSSTAAVNVRASRIVVAA